MQLSVIEQSKDRRRRLLREDRSLSDCDTTTSRRTQAKTTVTEGRTYSDTALADVETRITDFIPTRRWVLFSYLLLGLASVATVIGAYWFRNFAMNWFPEEAVASFRLRGLGTVACWLGSMMLMAAAIVCLAIYRIRRHKTDDYRGRYRLWLWASGLCVLASLDVVAGWHRMFQLVMIKLVDAQLWRDGSIWWIGFFVLVGLLTGFRMLLDMRHSLGSAFCLLVSLAFYSSALLFHFGLVDLADFDANQMSHAGSLLLGHWLLLYSLLLFSRFVHLAAASEIAVKKKSRKSTAAKHRRSPLGRKTSREQENEPTATKPSRRTAAAKKQAVSRAVEFEEDAGNLPEESGDFSENVDEMEILTDPNLSKTERRRLRKQLKRQQRRAA